MKREKTVKDIELLQKYLDDGHREVMEGLNESEKSEYSQLIYNSLGFQSFRASEALRDFRKSLFSIN